VVIVEENWERILEARVEPAMVWIPDALTESLGVLTERVCCEARE